MIIEVMHVGAVNVVVVIKKQFLVPDFVAGIQEVVDV
jgi:hypothetical protein